MTPRGHARIARVVAIGLAALIAGAIGLAPRAGTPPRAGSPTRDAGVDAEPGSLDDDSPDLAPDAWLAPELAELGDQTPGFDPTRTAPLGFDHVKHDRQVDTAGAEPIACRACHDLTDDGRPRGRPGHGACFGACHGAAPGRGRPLTVPDAQVPLCGRCHAGAALAARVAGASTPLVVAYPPFAFDRDWSLTLSHQTHAGDCAGCHRGSPAPPHTRCLGCHRPRAAAGAPPPITACTTCHAAVYGPAAGPSLVGGDLRLRGFDHARHRAAAPRAACTSCHGAITATASIALPTPTTATCATAGCHDGAAAFATTVACTRCHTRAAGASYRAPRPTARYDHRSHAGRQPAACETCHQLDPRGEARAPITPRARPATPTTSPAPRPGSAAPATSRPSRGATCAPIAPRRRRPSSARGSRTPRTPPRARPVTSRRRPASSRWCAATPGARARATGSRPGRRRTSRTAPAATRSASRATATPIGAPPRGRCAPGFATRPTCAGRIRRRAPRATAASTARPPVAAVPAPRKPACAPCHDGAIAFKLTGTGCVRCHGPRP